MLSYEETRGFFANGGSTKFYVTGNPVRPVFYGANPKSGLAFLGIEKKAKPILLVMGGSLGAAQINEMVWKNLSWLCQKFIVVHQTGQKNAELLPHDLSDEIKENYHPYPFIYAEMPSVIAASDVVLSRAGANSIWECAVLEKPIVLIPREGAGTRGDQVDNAEYFERQGAAVVIKKSGMTESSLQSALSSFLSAAQRKNYKEACKKLCGTEKPAEKIAQILFEGIK